MSVVWAVPSLHLWMMPGWGVSPCVEPVGLRVSGRRGCYLYVFLFQHEVRVCHEDATVDRHSVNYWASVGTSSAVVHFVHKVAQMVALAHSSLARDYLTGG